MWLLALTHCFYFRVFPSPDKHYLGQCQVCEQKFISISEVTVKTLELVRMLKLKVFLCSINKDKATVMMDELIRFASI